jgi:hypothetical protein
MRGMLFENTKIIPAARRSETETLDGEKRGSCREERRD